MTSDIDITFENTAGNAVLNIPDAPQSMILAAHNRTNDRLHTTALSGLDHAEQFHLRLRFRPHSLHDIGRLKLAPQSSKTWRLETHVDHDHTQIVSLRALRRVTWTRGEVEQIHLDGFGADARGGTRSSQLEVEIKRLQAVDGSATRTIDWHHHLPILIARSKVGAFDAARQIRTGSIARSGPITAGFVDGPGVLADGSTMSNLRLRLVNTSQSPVRFSGNSDTASRVELAYRTGSPTAPWGLLGGHGDHLTATLYDPQKSDAAQIEAGHWLIDGHVIRCVEDHTWGPGEWLDVLLDIHTSSPPGDAQLVVRLVDVPTMEDGELILLAHLAPLAVFPQVTRTIRPIELWGSSARLDFHAEQYSPGVATPAPASIALDGTDDLVINASPNVKVRGRLHVLAATGGNEHQVQLVVGDTSGTNLRLGWDAAYSWIQSHGPSPLRINPAGNPITLGAAVGPYDGVPLAIRDRLEVHGSWASASETKTQRDARSHLALGRADDHSWIQSIAGELRINRAGSTVKIGSSTWEPANDHERLVGAPPSASIIGPVAGGYLLTVGPDDAPALRFGYGTTRSGIYSDGGRHLTLNQDGTAVVIGSPNPPEAGAGLTVEGPLHVRRRRTDSGAELHLGNWKLVDDALPDGRHRIATYYNGVYIETIAEE